MTTKVIVPHLGESVESAYLVAWHKQVGDSVQRGEEIADIETDKATMPLECPQSGVLLAILVPANTDVKIGQTLAVVGESGEAWTPEKAGQADQPAPVAPPIAAPAAQSQQRPKVSPYARRVARELGIDLTHVQPEKGDAIASNHVRRYAAQQASQAGQSSEALPSHRVPLSSARRITGQRMLQSVQTVPQFSASINISAKTLQEKRAALADQGIAVSVTAMLVYLVADAIRQYPLVNAQFRGEDILVYDTCNIGVAVAAPDGLRVPVVHRAEQRTLAEIGTHISTLAERARLGRLSPDDTANATITVSNLGMLGITQFAPLVNPPQAAILAVGAVQPSLVPDDHGGIRLVPVMTVTMTADHRVLDGADVAVYLSMLKTLIELSDFARLQ